MRAPGRQSLARQYLSRRQAFLARLLIDTMSLSSNIVFDTSKVYTEKDTRTRRVFIIGVRLLHSHDKGGQRKERERWNMSSSLNACKSLEIFCAPGGLGWRLKTWDCREEADDEAPVS